MRLAKDSDAWGKCLCEASDWVYRSYGGGQATEWYDDTAALWVTEDDELLVLWQIGAYTDQEEFDALEQDKPTDQEYRRVLAKLLYQMDDEVFSGITPLGLSWLFLSSSQALLRVERHFVES